MATRECPVCSVRIVRNDPVLALCALCLRYFHSACLPATGSSRRCIRCTIGNQTITDTTSPAVSSSPATPNAKQSQPSLADSEPSEQATPTPNQYASKRRASTPSPSVVPVPKAYCATTAATAESSALLHDTVAMEQASATHASITTLDPDGQIKAALDGAPAYMQHFYQLLKSSHDSSAVAFAELRSSHTANVAALAENACALTENARMLNTVSSRVDEIDQRQQALSTRHDADIARLSKMQPSLDKTLTSLQRELTSHVVTLAITIHTSRLLSTIHVKL